MPSPASRKDGLSVLMFISQFRPIIGGAERQAEKLARALVRRGVGVEILTPRLDPSSPELEIDEGVTIRRFDLFDLYRSWPRLPGGLGPLNLAALRFQVQKAIGSRISDHDLLHTHIACPATCFAMERAHRTGRAAICTCASSGDMNDVLETSRQGIFGPAIARHLVRRMDCWLAISEAVRTSLLSLGVSEQRIERIPNGVDIPPAAERRNACGAVRRFLYLGRLSSTANRDVPSLIRAFDRVCAATAEPLELAIVGGGDLIEATRALAQEAEHADRILLPGFQDAPHWLEWADCFVLPSRFEGLSNALLEAMSHGLPCIANDIPPNREALDNGLVGVLVPVGDVEALSQAMATMVTTPDETARLGALARERVERTFTIDAVAAQHEEVYYKLLYSAAHVSNKHL